MLSVLWRHLHLHAVLQENVIRMLASEGTCALYEPDHKWSPQYPCDV